MEEERRGGFARHVDDADLNEEQKVKAVERPCCRFLDGTPISYILSIDSNIDNPTEETEQRPAETGIHRLGASTKSFWDQTQTSVERCGPKQRLRTGILPAPKRTETSRGGELFMERGRHVTIHCSSLNRP